MKNGIIYKSDGDALITIFKALRLDGTLKRPLTTKEMVLLFSIGKKLQEEIGVDG
jgi:hypothetical protein|nr:MAG TPA: hypothetical protein [Bacteriophage sp.]